MSRGSSRPTWGALAIVALVSVAVTYVVMSPDSGDDAQGTAHLGAPETVALRERDQRIARLELELERTVREVSRQEQIAREALASLGPSATASARGQLELALDKLSRLRLSSRYVAGKELSLRIVGDSDLQAEVLSLLRDGGTEDQLDALVSVMMWQPFAPATDEQIELFHASMTSGDSPARRRAAAWAWALHAMGRMTPGLLDRTEEQLRRGDDAGVLEAVAYIVREGELAAYPQIGEALREALRRLPPGPATTQLAVADLGQTHHGQRVDQAFRRFEAATTTAERDTYGAAFAELLGTERHSRIGRAPGASGVSLDDPLVTRVETVYARCSDRATRDRILTRVQAALGLTRQAWATVVRQLGESSADPHERERLATLSDAIRDGEILDTQTFVTRLDASRER